MLNRTQTTAFQGCTAAAGGGYDNHDDKRRVHISGKSLAYRMRGKGKVARAIVGARLIKQGLGISQLTNKQAAAILEVNTSYLNTAISLTPEEEMAALKVGHFQPARADVERLVARAGVEQTWDVLITNHLD
jgi:hypothetical protein